MFVPLLVCRVLQASIRADVAKLNVSMFSLVATLQLPLPSIPLIVLPVPSKSMVVEVSATTAPWVTSPRLLAPLSVSRVTRAALLAFDGAASAQNALRVSIRVAKAHPRATPVLRPSTRASRARPLAPTVNLVSIPTPLRTPPVSLANLASSRSRLLHPTASIALLVLIPSPVARRLVLIVLLASTATAQCHVPIAPLVTINLPLVSLIVSHVSRDMLKVVVVPLYVLPVQQVIWLP